MNLKNILTKKGNSLLLRLSNVISNLRWNQNRDNLSNVEIHCSCPLLVPRRGLSAYLKIIKNNYAKFTAKQNRQQKITSGKVIVKSKRNFLDNSIFKYFLIIVKDIFDVIIFKPRKRDFTQKDLKLLQNLLEENKGNFPKAWSQFYKITGTNQNTFNS